VTISSSTHKRWETQAKGTTYPSADSLDSAFDGQGLGKFESFDSAAKRGIASKAPTGTSEVYGQMESCSMTIY
jgi:hypothetical protein